MRQFFFCLSVARSALNFAADNARGLSSSTADYSIYNDNNEKLLFCRCIARKVYTWKHMGDNTRYMCIRAASIYRN